MELIQHIYQFKLPMNLRPREEAVKPPPSIFKAGRSNDASSVSLPPNTYDYRGDVNVYLIEGEKGNLLIDAGLNSPDSYSALVNGLKNYGFSLKDINYIFITHIHFDHSGQAGKVKQFSNAELYFSQTDMDVFQQNYLHPEEHHTLAREILLTSGVPSSEVDIYNDVFKNPISLVVPVTADHPLRDGDMIPFPPFEFVAMQTPGHSAGHICLYDPHKKFLFTGDTVLPQTTPNIGYYPGQGANPLGDYLASLEKIYGLEVNLAFPGHGPAFSGVRQIIESLVRHHEQRNKDAARALAGRTLTALQVAQEIPWMLDSGASASFDKMNLFDRRLAISEAMSHLEYLVQENEIGKNVENGVNLYFA